MIDHIQNGVPGVGQPQGRPGGRAPQPRQGAPVPEETGLPVTSESRSRLGPASAQLEELLRRLSTLESRERAGEDTLDERSEVQLGISAARVAIQNILSSETPSDPVPVNELPGDLARGVDLDPGDVLRLLE